jgi:drug/metabolite transporter (DMT)-like permease
VQPVIAATLGAAVLGERPGLPVAGGATLIFGGVFLAVRGPRAATPAPVVEP